ncbi:MAG: class I SAM-dependent methyltransferase [Candidatus Curtissbacteria bacterium]|nr:class I SAM-dependent methyltransferase [Candidatus Curtissbacteria bacterium]
MKIRSQCSICGNDSFLEKYHFKDYSIFECKKCHFIYRDRILSRKEDESLYDKDYYLNLQKEYFINCLTPNPKDKSRLRDFNKRLDLLEKLLGRNKKIRLLDIGAGTGAFTYLAEKRDWQTVSIEISRFASGIARSKFNVRMYCGEVTDKNFEEKGFDVITLWEAIANIEDTRLLLKTTRNLLNKNGKIAILTTVVDSWLFYIADVIRLLTLGRVTYFVKEGYPIHHANHFSRKNLRNVLKSEGFKVIYTDNVEIPYKYTKLPRSFFPVLVTFGSLAKLFNRTIQVMIIAEKVK